MGQWVSTANPGSRADADALSAWAERERERGNLSAALSGVRKALKQLPGDQKLLVQKWSYKAALYEEQGRLPKAAKYHKRVLRLDPRRQDSIHALARIKLRQNDYDGAMVHLSHYVELREAAEHPQPVKADDLPGEAHPPDVEAKALLGSPLQPVFRDIKPAGAGPRANGSMQPPTKALARY
eukprot:RCo012530